MSVKFSHTIVRFWFFLSYLITTVASKLTATYKDVHIVVPFAYLLSSFRKFEWAENAAVQACTKKWQTDKWTDGNTHRHASQISRLDFCNMRNIEYLFWSKVWRKFRASLHRATYNVQRANLRRTSGDPYILQCRSPLQALKIST